MTIAPTQLAETTDAPPAGTAAPDVEVAAPAPVTEGPVEHRPGIKPLPPWYLAAWRLLQRGIAALPRPWSQRQPCLAEMVEFSRSGDWTPSRQGPRRSLHLSFVVVVLVPIKFSCDAVSWAVERPGRFGYSLLVTGVLASAANLLAGPLIPDVLTIPFWLGRLWPWS